MSTVTVRIPTALRPLASGAAEVPVAADSVRGALVELARDHELLVQRVLTRGGELRPYVNLFVDDADVRLLDGLDTRLRPHQTLRILPSVAGG